MPGDLLSCDACSILKGVHARCSPPTVEAMGLNMKDLRIFDHKYRQTEENSQVMGSFFPAGDTLPEFRYPSNTLETRWKACAKAAKWSLCLEIARSFATKMPECPLAWIYVAHSTQRVPGGTVHMAYDVLLSAARKSPKEPLIFYGLAHYACKLDRLEEAAYWLERASEFGDSTQLRLMALRDADLEPIWQDLGRS
jgi:hypothetical protein